MSNAISMGDGAPLNLAAARRGEDVGLRSGAHLRGRRFPDLPPQAQPMTPWPQRHRQFRRMAGGPAP
eukprot:5092073-Lingulodinium_polyedra.AAC.1